MTGPVLSTNSLSPVLPRQVLSAEDSLQDDKSTASESADYIPIKYLSSVSPSRLENIFPVEIWENIFKICEKLGFHPKEIIKYRVLNQSFKKEIDTLYKSYNPLRMQRIEYETKKLKSEINNIYNSSIGEPLLDVEKKIEKILYDKKFLDLSISYSHAVMLRTLKCFLLKRNVEYLDLKIDFLDYSNINLDNEHLHSIFFMKFGLFLKENKNLTYIKRLQINHCKINESDLQEILPNLMNIEICLIELINPQIENNGIENNGCEILVEYLPKLNIYALGLDCSRLSEGKLVELFKNLPKSIKVIYLVRATLNQTQHADIICDAIKKSNVEQLELFYFSATKEVKEKMRRLEIDTANTKKFVEVTF